MRIALFLLPALLLGGPISAPAQARESTDAHLRNDCPRAARIIGTGRPEHRRAWAFDTIRQCDVTGPRVLAEIWRGTPPNDHAGLRRLASATRRLTDRSLFMAVFDAGANPGLGTNTRTYALSLVTNYADPALWLDVRDLLDTSRVRPARVYSISDDDELDDVSELGEIRPLVQALLSRLAAQDPDPMVRRVAAAHQNLLASLPPVTEPK